MPMVPDPGAPIKSVSYSTKIMIGGNIALNPPRRPNVKILAILSKKKTVLIIVKSIANANGRRHNRPS